MQLARAAPRKRPGENRDRLAGRKEWSVGLEKSQLSGWAALIRGKVELWLSVYCGEYLILRCKLSES
jgi:hypothetical protein